MSQRRRRRADEESNNTPGLGILAAGAAVAGLAGLAYGAKKLYDYVTEESRAAAAKLGPQGAATGPPRPSPGPSSVGHGTDRRAPPHSGGRCADVKDSRGPVVSLARSLDVYYRQRACVVPLVLEDETRAAWGLQVQIERALTAQRGADTRLTPVGSSADGTLVAAATRVFDFLVPVSVDEWSLEAAGAGSYRCVQPESPALELTAAAALADLADSLTQGGLRVTAEGATVTVCDDHVTVRVIPTLVHTERRVCAVGAPGGVAWRLCDPAREAAILALLDPAHCCHLRCLQVTKALRVDHPAQFGALPAYIYKTVLLQMIQDTPDPDFWRPQCLPEQFIDLLNQLVVCLQARRLPSLGDATHNLLEGVPGSVCDALTAFITHRIGKENLHTLLGGEGSDLGGATGGLAV